MGELMDIREIREKKKILEDEIRELVINFCNETTLGIYGIRLEIIETTEFGSPKSFSYTSVCVDLAMNEH